MIGRVTRRALLVCLVAVPGLCQEMQTALDLDFSQVPAAWRLPLRDGALYVKTGLTMLPVVEVTDAVVEYRVKVEGEGLVEFMFRYNLDTDDYYLFRVDTRLAGGNPPGFLKRNQGDPPWVIAGERTGVAPLPDTWANVRVEIAGDTFRGYVDDELVATFQDADFASGGLAFRSQVSEGSVDDLRIRIPQGAEYTLLQPAPRRVDAPAPFTEGVWSAEWVWSPGTDDELTRVLRKRFDVPGPVREASVAVTCDNEYDLFLNGQRIGGDQDWYSVETYDVAKLLRRGENVLAALCRNHGPGSAGLLLELGATTQEGHFVHVVSGSLWRVSKTAPEGWQTAALDDSTWPNAQSLGKHPQAPWATQATLRLPYLGPKQPIELVRASAPEAIAIGAPVRIAATWQPLQPLTEDYPLVLRLRQGDGAWVDAAVVQPQQPTRAWPVGEAHAETLAVPLWPDIGYLLDGGPVTLGLEVRGTFYANRPDYAIGKATFQSSAGAENRARPRTARLTRSGSFTDPAGRQRAWSVDAEGRVVVDGTAYIPLDPDGVYWCEATSAGEALAALDWRPTVERLCAEGGPSGADFVRVRLTDHIDATSTDHEFSEDGGLGGHSRVLHIGDRDYRVTSARRRLSYFAFTAACEHPRNPHLMLFQSVNDRERYTTLRIQPPWDNVGGGVYTGREYPCDGRPFEHRFLFYPRAQRIRFTISRMPDEQPTEPESGAAVSHVWLFELLDPLGSASVAVADPPGEKRRLGMYLTHPGYLYSLYGYRGDNREERRASLRSFVDYLRFCGINLLEFNAVDGGDTTGTAYYKNALWPQAAGSLLEELLPLCEANDIQVLPIVTSLSVPEGKFGFTRDSFQLDRFGNLTEFFASRPPLPDPLRPEVQDLLLRNLREILDVCARSKAVPGIGFRVNGKIGLCYGGADLGTSDQYTGYSAWDVAQFEGDTGLDVPEMQPTPYEWIKANCWERWLDWRCERTRDFWLRCRDAVREYRRDLVLYVSCDMPSETPAWNIYWPEGETPLNCWRYHGVDPRMFADEPGILLQRGMMIAADRYFTGFSQYGENVEAMKTFHYGPGVTELYAGREGAACELYHNYWEESGVIPMGEFGTDFWGAATMYPFGRHYFEPLAFSLGKTNCHTLNLFSWERGSFGHEHDLRAFARAFRALPRGDGDDATSLVVGAAEGLWVCQFGDRLAVLNETAEPRTVTLRYPKTDARALIEFARYEVIPAPGNAEIELPLDAYELRVLGRR